MKYQKIPDETIRRMPMYLRAFSMLKMEDQDTISSDQLAERLHMNPPQIRKDLSYFGAFGTRGIGYPVASTAKQIRSILKLNITQKAVLVGAGVFADPEGPWVVQRDDKKGTLLAARADATRLLAEGVRRGRRGGQRLTPRCEWVQSIGLYITDFAAAFVQNRIPLAV